MSRCRFYKGRSGRDGAVRARRPCVYAIEQTPSPHHTRRCKTAIGNKQLRPIFERVRKGGRVLTKLEPVTVGDLVIQCYQVATVDLPTDDEAAAMSEVVLMKYVIRDKLIQHRKIPSDTPALVYVEEASYAEFLYLPRAFSHMARCATHRVPLYFGAFTPHTQAASWKLA